jgi:translocation and assembly module TamB
LPQDITQLDGMLGADLKLEIGRTLKADLNALLEPVTLTYLADASHQVRLHHQGGYIKAHLGGQELAAEFKLSVGEHGTHGHITVPRKTLEKDVATAPLSGNIFVDVKELGLLTAFVPEIQQAEGSIVAQLKLHGVLTEPQMSGHATLVSSQVHIPAAGIKLKNTHFEITGKGSRDLFITGQSQSGDGMINLNGKLTLDAEQNWPVQLALSGNHFLAVNLPQAQILVTPDLEIKHHQQGLVISGKITIPEAEITPRTIPEDSYDISPDVVIISEENSSGEPQTSTAIDARITLILGNKVHFNGFGLKAHLAGQMTVQQKPHQLATANGELTIVSGSYRAIGQNLTIEQGRLSYAGGYLDNPGLNFRASREVQDTTVGVSMSGTLQSPKFSTFSSEPGMSSSDRTSLLLTGQTLDNVGKARFYAGRDVTNKLSVGVNAGGDEGSEFVARYKLRPNVHVEATSSAEKSGGKILYTIEIE